MNHEVRRTEVETGISPAVRPLFTKKLENIFYLYVSVTNSETFEYELRNLQVLGGTVYIMY
jgi:hypothetical protein